MSNALNNVKKLRDIVCPSQFGAKGDGVTNDGQAVLNAIATGKDVYFPPNLTYLMNGFVIVPISGQTLFGPGRLLNTIDTIPAQFVKVLNVSNVEIDGLHFDCTGSPSRIYGVTVQGSTNTLIHNCRSTAATFCFVWRDSVRTKVKNNRISGGQFGIATGGDAAGATNGVVFDTEISGNHISGCTSEGIDVNWDTQRCLISGNVLVGNNTVDAEEEIDIGGGVCRDIIVTGNLINGGGTSTGGITVKLGTVGTVITDNILKGFASTSGKVGIELGRSGGITDAIVANNTIDGAFNGVIINTGATKTRVIGNTITGMGSTGVGVGIGAGSNVDCHIKDNTIDGGGTSSHGIQIQNITDYLVSGNIVKNTAANADGIQLLSTASRGTVSGNDISLCDDGIICLATDTNISGNISYLNDKTGVTVQAVRCSVTNNTIYNNAQTAAVYGLVLQTGSDYCTINGNRITDTQGTKTQRGFQIVGACARVIIMGNFIFDNLTTNITGTGSLTNSIYSTAENIVA